MDIKDRVEMNQEIAEGYRNAYMQKEVEGGKRYDAWNFAPGAEYVSPYWTGDEIWILGDQPMEAGKTAIMEAQAITLVYPDWKVIDSHIWAASDGFVLKNKWVGHKKDGSEHWYYSHTFARTNEEGQITRWETHVDENFGPFIEAVIGTRGPWSDQTTYMSAIAKALDNAGVEY